MRRRRSRSSKQSDSFRVNHQIRISRIRVIGPDGDQLGIMSPDEGRTIAKDHGLDLVEVAPKARPPVCRVMDYGKFRYQQSKKQTSSKKTQLKTIRLRPKTDSHDLNTKVRKALQMLDNGNPVRLVMRMRGRERAHVPRWIDKMHEVVEEFGDAANVTGRPKKEGRTITVTLEPAAEAS